jgi:hypothetical protein
MSLSEFFVGKEKKYFFGCQPISLHSWRQPNLFARQILFLKYFRRKTLDKNMI